MNGVGTALAFLSMIVVVGCSGWSSSVTCNCEYDCDGEAQSVEFLYGEDKPLDRAREESEEECQRAVDYYCSAAAECTCSCLRSI